jgi:hypothetical protein
MTVSATGLSNANATMSYTTETASFSFGTKVRGVASGWTVLATESHARLHRAMYPMQKTEGAFALLMDLNGYTEYQAVMNFLINYIGALLGTSANPAGTPQTSGMTVQATLPNGLGDFIQVGVPFTGMGDGDHVGSMVFNPVVVFMPVIDPSDPAMYTSATGAAGISWENFANTNSGDASQFYYPRSSGSLDPNAYSQSLYDVPVSTPTSPNNPAAATTGPQPDSKSNGGYVNNPLVAPGISNSTINQY